MTDVEVDNDWADSEDDEAGISDGPQESAESTVDEQATTLETKLIRDLANHDIEVRGMESEYIAFSAHPKWGEYPYETNHLPRDRSAELAATLARGATLCTRWAGIAIPTLGYIEVLIRPNSSVPTPSSAIRSLSRMVADEIDIECRHVHDGGGLESLDFTEHRRGEPDVKLHLVGEKACLEVSPPSSTCHILANSGYRGRPRFSYAVKMDFGQSMKLEEIEAAAEPLLNSLIYELDVRNGTKLRVVRWPSRVNQQRPTRTTRPNRIVRFPETRIDPEVSVLFGFAGSASGNPPLAFLSYYQVLENFFPVAARRNALRKLELELTDPRFDRHNDKYLMRLLSVGENAATSSESSQLKVLVEEFVRDSSLRDFFADHDWGKHFTRNGPIRGVNDNINPENRQTSLSNQVADRVYRIRNRIVHAKDDPKFESTPALLPQSDEAEALGPDIELVRFLAYEVILSAQARGR